MSVSVTVPEADEPEEAAGYTLQERPVPLAPGFLNKVRGLVLAKRPKKLLALALALALGLGGLGFYRNRQRQLAEAVVPVGDLSLARTVTLQKGSLENTVPVSGTVKSGLFSTVTTAQTAKVLTVPVKVGDSVKKGTVICTLDPTELDKQIAEKRKQIETEAKKSATDAALTLSQLRGQIARAQTGRQENQKTLDAAVQTAKSKRDDADKARRNAKNEYSSAESAYNSAKNSYDSVCSALQNETNAYQNADTARQNAYAAWEAAGFPTQTATAAANAPAPGEAQPAAPMQQPAALPAEAEPTPAPALPEPTAPAGEQAGPHPLYTAYQEAEAALSAAQAQLELARGVYGYAAAAEGLAAAKAAMEEKSAAVAAAEEGYRAAEEGVKAAEESRTTTLRSLDDALAELQDQLATAAAKGTPETDTGTLKELLDQREQYTIKAETDGEITELNATVGAIPTKEALARIQSATDLLLHVQIPEAEINNVKVGQQVRITADSLQEPVQGTLSSINPTAENGEGGMGAATVTGYGADIRIENGNGLHIGSKAKGEIILDTKQNVYTVPLDAVTTNEDGESCVRQLLEDGSTKDIIVTTGAKNSFLVEIEAAALKDGIRVLAAADWQGLLDTAAAGEVGIYG